MAEEDIIFGKHRHLFGGIEPSNMRRFYTEWDANAAAVRIDAELPEDTVVDGQTVCSVEGAVIRRKTTGYPKDEFDGDLVMTINESGSFLDTGATDEDIVYYYSAFPFSRQGVYTRNEANSAKSFEVMGKCTYFTRILTTGIRIVGSRTTVNSNYSLAGYMIRRRTDRYPTDINDGDQVLSTTSSTSSMINYTDTNVTSGQTYYYSIFEYYKNSSGAAFYRHDPCVLDRYRPKKLSATYRNYNYLYGFDLDINDPNPSTRVTYPNDVDNASFTPAKMDYENGTFYYGDWPDVPNSENAVSFIPTPYMIYTDGSATNRAVEADDYGIEYATAGTSSAISDTTHTGNAMMRWPKIYTYREYDSITGIYKFRCSDYKHSDEWECWCNYDKNGNEIDYFYTAIYPACETTGPKLRSLSGQSIETGSYAQYQMDYADNNGDGWNIETIADRLLIQDLLILMAKTTDCQKAYGKGVCGGNDAITKTGTMDKRGLFWGSEDPSEGVKVFGMEHWWGNKYRRVAGLVSVDGKYKLKITRSTKDGSTATDFNYDGTGYKSLGYGFDCEVSQSIEYISDMRYTGYGRLPEKGKGTSTRCEADAVTIAKSGTMFANCGGASALKEGYVGPFALTLTESKGTSTSNDICVALSYKA